MHGGDRLILVTDKEQKNVVICPKDELLDVLFYIEVYASIKITILVAHEMIGNNYAPT